MKIKKMYSYLTIILLSQCALYLSPSGHPILSLIAPRCYIRLMIDNNGDGVSQKWSTADDGRRGVSRNTKIIYDKTRSLEGPSSGLRALTHISRFRCASI